MYVALNDGEEGKTDFRGKKPDVHISQELSNEPRYENRLRTTLAHEFGHVHFHGPFCEMKKAQLTLDIFGKDTFFAEVIPALVFVVMAALGFRKNLWFVVAGLALHGFFDFFHHAVIANPGDPVWGKPNTLALSRHALADKRVPSLS